MADCALLDLEGTRHSARVPRIGPQRSDVNCLRPDGLEGPMSGSSCSEMEGRLPLAEACLFPNKRPRDRHGRHREPLGFRIGSVPSCNARQLESQVAWVTLELMPGINEGLAAAPTAGTSEHGTRQWGKDERSRAMGKGTVPPKARQTAEIPPFQISVDTIPGCAKLSIHEQLSAMGVVPTESGQSGAAGTGGLPCVRLLTRTYFSVPNFVVTH